MGAIESALSAFTDHLGPAPICEAMMPPVLMPMHLAVDARPFMVRGQAGAAFFLKLYSADMLAFIDLGVARDAARAAGARGIAPRLVACDEAAGAILFEWLPPDAWRMAMRDDMENSDTRAAVIAAKRAWHASPPLADTRDPFDAIRGYRETIAALAGANPNAAPPSSLATLAAWSERIEQGMRAAGIDEVPLHGENTLGNIMLGVGGEVRLVDFDQAGNGDRFYDLGALCLEYCAFDDEIEDAVELYVGHADRRALARAKLYMIIDDIRWGCWALIAHWTSPRATSVEFYKYARNRFVRAIYRLEGWDVDALLRRA